MSGILVGVICAAMPLLTALTIAILYRNDPEARLPYAILAALIGGMATLLAVAYLLTITTAIQGGM